MSVKETVKKWLTTWSLGKAAEVATIIPAIVMIFGLVKSSPDTPHVSLPEGTKIEDARKIEQLTLTALEKQLEVLQLLKEYQKQIAQEREKVAESFRALNREKELLDLGITTTDFDYWALSTLKFFLVLYGLLLGMGLMPFAFILDVIGLLFDYSFPLTGYIWDHVWTQWTMGWYWQKATATGATVSFVALLAVLVINAVMQKRREKKRQSSNPHA